MKASAAAPEHTTVPVGVPESFDEHVKLQSDLLALAFRADITRVATMLFARDLTHPELPRERDDRGVPCRARIMARTPSESGVRAGEPVSHRDAGVSGGTSWPRPPDGDGTLLDHSLILYGSNMGNSNSTVMRMPRMCWSEARTESSRVDGHLLYPTRAVPTGQSAAERA
jgi:hypothetical protein